MVPEVRSQMRTMLVAAAVGLGFAGAGVYGDVSRGAVAWAGRHDRAHRVTQHGRTGSPERVKFS